MRHRFRGLGFTLRDEGDLGELFRRAAAAGERRRGPRGTYVVWAPGAGIELWVQHNPRGGVIGCSPHFDGLGRMRLGVTRIVPGGDSPLEGSLVGWADPAGDEPESGAYALAVEVPDLDLIRDRLPVPSRVTVQPVAFAREVHCFRDEGEFAASQAPGESWPPESFVATGLYGADGSEREPPEAEAFLAGHIQHAEVRANPVTGESFRYLIVRTVGGIVDVVADPLVVAGEPATGGVIQGAFTISARVVAGVRPIK